MIKKIAVEEHFLCPGFEDYWAPTVTDLASKKRDQFFACLTDFGESRLESMNRAGVQLSVLSIAGPGVQAERDTPTACRRARAKQMTFWRVKCAHLSPSSRPGYARPCAGGPPGPAARHVGVDIRDRVACFAHRVRRRFRSVPARSSCSATWARPLSIRVH